MRTTFKSAVVNLILLSTALIFIPTEKAQGTPVRFKRHSRPARGNEAKRISSAKMGRSSPDDSHLITLILVQSPGRFIW